MDIYLEISCLINSLDTCIPVIYTHMEVKEHIATHKQNREKNKQARLATCDSTGYVSILSKVTETCACYLRIHVLICLLLQCLWKQRASCLSELQQPFRKLYFYLKARRN